MHTFDLAINRKYFISFFEISTIVLPSNCFLPHKAAAAGPSSFVYNPRPEFPVELEWKKHRSYISYVIVDNVRTLDKGMEDSQISPGSMGTVKMVFSLRNLTRSQ